MKPPARVGIHRCASKFALNGPGTFDCVDTCETESNSSNWWHVGGRHGLPVDSAVSWLIGTCGIVEAGRADAHGIAACGAGHQTLRYSPPLNAGLSWLLVSQCFSSYSAQI